jgi:20S proteasome subunit alpha 3
LQPGTGEVQYQVCSPEAMGKLLAKAGLSQPAPEA